MDTDPLTNQLRVCSDMEQDISLDNEDSETFLPLHNQLILCSDMLAEDPEEFATSSEMSVELNPGCSRLSDGLNAGCSGLSAGLSDGLSELASLGVHAYDHSQLEKKVMDNIDKKIKDQEEKKRKEDASRELKVVEEDIRIVNQRLDHIEKAVSLGPKDPKKLIGDTKKKVMAMKLEREKQKKHLNKMKEKRKVLNECISGSQSRQGGAREDNVELDQKILFNMRQMFASGSQESEEERLVRTGEMTPFGTRSTPAVKEGKKAPFTSKTPLNLVRFQDEERQELLGEETPSAPKSISITENTDFDRFLLSSDGGHMNKKAKTVHKPLASPAKGKCIVIKNSKADFQFTDMKAVPAKRRKSNLLKIQNGSFKCVASPSKKKNKSKSLVRNYKSDSEVSSFGEEEQEREEEQVPQYSDEDVYVPGEDSADDDDDYDDYNDSPKERKGGDKKKAVKASANTDDDGGCSVSRETKSRVKKLVDDGDHKSFIKRIKAYDMSVLKKKHRRIMESEDGVVDSDEEDFTELDEGYKVPNSIWNKLYKYQQTCVHWLWELHQQNCGGIVGDEMGLGKTIQIIAFLAGLSTSNLRVLGDTFRGLGPVLLVCPTTVMHQWVKEFHTWWPPFRVVILHDSGSFSGKKDTLISSINKHGGVLITSYAGLVSHQERLLECEWHYVILDEGHKIRNPFAQATIAAKRFCTCHRVILSGSPVQNHLRELWSLFDFVFPGKLGTLPVFMQEFSIPIILGGYANANQTQVQTAYKCCTVLRDAIKPYLLRRMKSDVKMNINLPNKSEQVLFCQLTEHQINLYKGYIDSKEVGSILSGRLQVFVGLINLRKICNHPDLFDGGPKIFTHTDVNQLEEEEKYGYYKRSGKMAVVEALLRLWHRQGHRVLLFTQSRQMMDILEIFVKSRGYSYMKMDGSTSIPSRQPAIDKFNSDPNVFVFLLTTRVGGVGVNLIGADRVVIYDPDWNPSTDAQARERAWRIGQKKQVTVYRLLTAGTIEEKIYHRQIFKQFVTNRVLKDPKQRRFFKSNDLFELFSYKELGTEGTETSAIFAGTGSEIRPKRNVQRSRGKDLPPKDSSAKVVPETVTFSEEKREQMRQLAKRLAMSLSSTGLEAKSGTTIELNSKSNPEVNSGTTIELNSKNNPEAPSESSLGLISRNVSDIQSGTTLELNSGNESEAKPETTLISDLKSKGGLDSKSEATLISSKTSEKTLIDKKMLTERASKKKTVKDKHKDKARLLEDKTSKKSKKKKSARIEGEKIDFLVKKSVYKPPEDEAAKSKREDDYVLSKLFKTSGVHTALRHDTIVDSSAPDFAIIEGEAQRVANEAIKAVRESRKQCRPPTSGVPTWTGRTPRFGQKKRVPPGLDPEPSTSRSDSCRDSGTIKRTKFDGRQNQGGITSSSDLLAAIRRRKEIFLEEDQDDCPPPSWTSTTTKHDVLLADILNFVAIRESVNGKATTEEIIGAFRDKVPGNQTAIFKAMLKKICHFSKNESGEGLWQLKEEFR